MDTTGGLTFRQLLALPKVTERHTLRSRFGVLAYHGGYVERVTSLIASMASERANATVYLVEQPADHALHIPSTRVRPEDSDMLAEVLGHVRTVCTVHGYGREMDKQHILIGGRNRDLARHVGQHLDEQLDGKYPIVTDLDAMPPELRGVHPKNPANVPADGGVQLELPPAVRWNFEARVWADEPGVEPTSDVLAVVDGLAEAIRTWG